MIIQARNATLHFLYKYALKPILFQFDPEFVHKTFIKIGILLGSNPLTKSLTSLAFNHSSPILNQKILGITFKNPIGLSAGFDKNAELTSILPKIGFGFEEVGSITAMPCAGNSGLRLKRLPEKKSLWVHFGLNNNGTDEIISRLKKKKFEIPLGISIAKTNCKETANVEVAIKDYIYSLKKFEENNVGSYYTINISCPNAFGGQPFTDSILLEKLMKQVYSLKLKTPYFLKISPDLTKQTLDKIIFISQKYRVSGFVCANLTKNHEYSKGGLSGKVVEKSSNESISYIYKKTKGKFILIGVGGVFSAQDAYEKIKRGASLIQLITGMIYEGPQLISQINLDLEKLIKKEGYANINEAIGKGSN
ncbi:MAG: quinone-dependent dihydroorotate dehydrogenase [Nanoarchaeota archaeon]